MRGIHKWLPGYIAIPVFMLIATGNCQAMDGPDSIELNTLAELYEPVLFDHAMHVEATGENCAECHHHTTGMPATDNNCARCHDNSEGAEEVTCQGCHSSQRFEADYLRTMEENNMLYHTDKIGLKAAYHLKCMTCHQEMDAPNGCQDCHVRNKNGDKFFHSGRYAPIPEQQPSGGH